MSINHVTIAGNLTRDPKLRATAGGIQIMNFSVAVNDRRKNQQTGEWEDYPNFIDCVMFGTRAESLSRYLSKGSKVAVEGKLHYSSWERDGQKRSKVEVIVDELEFMSRGDARQSAPAPAYGPQTGYPSQLPNKRYSAPQTAPQAPAGAQGEQPRIFNTAQPELYAEDIPF